MKARTLRRAIAMIIVLSAAVVLGSWYTRPSRREAYIAHCVDYGDGGMFSSRQYCEQSYDRSVGKH
jgi:hypothetical protein